jgi:hypothetical protein
MNYPKSTKNNTVLIEVNKLPNLFRIENIGIERGDDQSYFYRATLYSATQTITVTWLSQEERKDLSYGVLVRGVWITRRIFAQGTNIIQSLQKVKGIGVNENLENTVMPNWVYDGFACGFLFDQINQLPATHRSLVLNIIRDHYVLYHFLKIPVSWDGDLCKLGSNFQKTAELLGFLNNCLHNHKFNAPREVILTAGVLLGIGHYNKFKFDHQTQRYYEHDLTHAHDPKIVAIGLIHKAIERTKNINLELINDVISAIDHLEFNY